VDDGSGLSIRPADYDGSVQLATMETDDDEFYSVQTATPTPTVLDMKMLASYTATLDLDLHDGPDGQNQTDVQQVPTQELAFHGLWDPAKPNTLYPDGTYSERDRAPAYLDQGNAHGFHGLMSFWIKLNHTLPGGLNHIRGHPHLTWTNYTTDYLGADDDGQNPSQCFRIVNRGVSSSPTAPKGFSCFFEIGHDDFDTYREHKFEAVSGSLNLSAGRYPWFLVSLHWDFRSPQADDTGELCVRPTPFPWDFVPPNDGNWEMYAYGNTPAAASDITIPDLHGSHRIILGDSRSAWSELSTISLHVGRGADATLDEFALYDFGGAGPGGVPANPPGSAPSVFSSNRFSQGRYYKESAYAGLTASPGLNLASEYFSPSLRLDSGPSRIRLISWTQVVPKPLRAPVIVWDDTDLAWVPVGTQGIDYDPGPGAAISFELTDLAGSNYLTDASGASIDLAFRTSAGSALGRTVSQPFRLHAVFQPNLADTLNTPILDPLALDDVTILYEPAEGLRLLSWEAGT
jgi:hypothetical protein